MVRTIDHYCIRLPIGATSSMQDCVGIWFQYDQELKDFIKTTLSDLRPTADIRYGMRKDQVGSWWAELGMWWCHKRIWPGVYTKLQGWADQHAGDWELNNRAVACPPYVAKRYAKLFRQQPEHWGSSRDVKPAPEYEPEPEPEVENTTQQETAFDDIEVNGFDDGKAAEESSRAQAAAFAAWQIRMQKELEDREREQARRDAEHKRRVHQLYEEQTSYRPPPPPRYKPTVLSVLDVYSLSLMGLGWPYTADQLRTEYRARCRIAHPDTGGTEEAFKRLQAAYKHVQGIRT